MGAKLIAMGAAAAMLVGALALPGPADDAPDPTPAKAGPISSSTVPAGRAGRALAGGAAASCAYGYSPETVAQRAGFAFDGTVTAVGSPRSNRAGSGNPLDLVGVSLRVAQWFRGGDAATVVVDMPAPAHAADGEDSLGVPQYGVGTRLLVSGAARWGADAPLAAAIAWWGCGGFTRYYSPAVAAEWAAAIRGVSLTGVGR